MNPQLKSVGKTGLFPGQKLTGVTHEDVILTIPAKELLRARGATVEPGKTERTCNVTFPSKASVPTDLVVSIVDYKIAVRLSSEPEWPGEHEADYWQRLAWQPCPVCGAAIMWYEAGYVPGYRVCARKPHHHLRA